MPTALTLSGSVRTGSFNQRLALLMGQALAARGAAVDYVDLGAYPLPLFDENLEIAEGEPAAAAALAQKFAEADIVFIASPEYNGSVTPLLKNTIDWLSRQKTGPFKRAIFGIGAVSAGKLAGVGGLSHLRDILAKLNAATAPTALGLGPSDTAFTEDGDFADPVIKKRAEMLADQLFWLSSN